MGLLLSAKKTVLNPIVSLLIERADLDAHRTAVVFRKVWETFGIVKHSNQPVFMLDRFVIESIRWAVTNAALTGFAEI